MYRGLYSAVMVELVSDANYVLTRLAVEIEQSFIFSLLLPVIAE